MINFLDQNALALNLVDTNEPNTKLNSLDMPIFTAPILLLLITLGDGVFCAGGYYKRDQKYDSHSSFLSQGILHCTRNQKIIFFLKSTRS